MRHIAQKTKRYDPEFTDDIPAYLTDDSDFYNWFPEEIGQRCLRASK